MANLKRHKHVAMVENKFHVQGQSEKYAFINSMKRLIIDSLYALITKTCFCI